MRSVLNSSKFKRLKQFIWDIVVNKIISSYIIPLKLRNFLLRIVGVQINKSPIHGNCYIGSRNIIIGNNSYVNRECFFDNENGSQIKIGNNCAIAYRVMFITTNHELFNSKKRCGEVIKGDIIVNDGCWIGANSVILPGVVIEEGCVIAAGSVVARNCETNSIYAGIPAKKIKQL